LPWRTAGRGASELALPTWAIESPAREQVAHPKPWNRGAISTPRGGLNACAPRGVPAVHKIRGLFLVPHGDREAVGGSVGAFPTDESQQR
jgi:hypothetical protein